MTKPRRGRPIEYDPALALEQATDLFWSLGFADTSLEALSRAMRMTRPSLAGAFGDKEAIYIATLERYRNESTALLKQTLSGERPFRDELSNVYARAMDGYLAARNDAARGCLLIGTASVEAVNRPAVRRALQQSLDAFSEVLEARMRKAVAEGELAAADPAGHASMACAVLHSLAVRARAGEKRPALEALAKSAVGLICGET